MKRNKITRHNNSASRLLRVLTACWTDPSVGREEREVWQELSHIQWPKVNFRLPCCTVRLVSALRVPQPNAQTQKCLNYSERPIEATENIKSQNLSIVNITTIIHTNPSIYCLCCIFVKSFCMVPTGNWARHLISVNKIFNFPVTKLGNSQQARSNRHIQSYLPDAAAAVGDGQTRWPRQPREASAVGLLTLLTSKPKTSPVLLALAIIHHWFSYFFH